MEINNIGNNAGLIWNALNVNGKMTETKLKKETGLASADFYAALGWLAREGKLNTIVETRCGKDCEYFTLSSILLKIKSRSVQERDFLFIVVDCLMF